MDIPKLPRIKNDDENMEKLHVSARKGQVDHIRRLLNAGVPADLPNKFGCTALHLAIKHNQMGVVQELISSEADLSSTWHGQKPLHLAVVGNAMDITRLILDTARDQGKTSFEYFVNECDEYETSIIGDHYRAVSGQTALHWCVGLGDKYLPMLQLLLSYGASPVAKDRNFETPLMRAIEFGNTKAFNCFLNPPGTPVSSVPTSTTTRLDSTDREGRGNLHYSIFFNRSKMSSTLLELGHEVATEDEDKMTPLLLAMRAGMPDVLEVVLERVEPFAIQSAPFHNGSQVQIERVDWLSFVPEDDYRKADCAHVFQRKLELVSKKNESKEGKKKNKSRFPRALGKRAPSQKRTQ